MLFDDHVLICGAPRSGTTALAVALNRMFPLITNELDHYIDLAYYSTYEHTLFNLSVITRRRWGFDLLHRMTCEQDQNFFDRYKAVMAGHLDTIRGSFFEDTSPEMKTTLSTELEKSEDNSLTYIGDKSPRYTMNLMSIADRFPRINIICMQRDGREVAASLLRLGWAKSVESAFETWVEHVRAWHTYKPLLDSYLEIERSELLNDPSAVAAKVNKYLRIFLPDDYFTGYVSKKGVRDVAVGKSTPYWDQLFNESDIPASAMDWLNVLGYTSGGVDA